MNMKVGFSVEKYREKAKTIADLARKEIIDEYNWPSERGVDEVTYPQWRRISSFQITDESGNFVPPTAVGAQDVDEDDEVIDDIGKGGADKRKKSGKVATKKRKKTYTLWGYLIPNPNSQEIKSVLVQIPINSFVVDFGSSLLDANKGLWVCYNSSRAPERSAEQVPYYKLEYPTNSYRPIAALDFLNTDKYLELCDVIIHSGKFDKHGDCLYCDMAIDKLYDEATKEWGLSFDLKAIRGMFQFIHPLLFGALSWEFSQSFLDSIDPDKSHTSSSGKRKLYAIEDHIKVSSDNNSNNSNIQWWNLVDANSKKSEGNNNSSSSAKSLLSIVFDPQKRKKEEVPAQSASSSIIVQDAMSKLASKIGGTSNSGSTNKLPSSSSSSSSSNSNVNNKSRFIAKKDNSRTTRLLLDDDDEYEIVSDNKLAKSDIKQYPAYDTVLGRTTSINNNSNSNSNSSNSNSNSSNGNSNSYSYSKSSSKSSTGRLMGEMTSLSREGSTHAAKKVRFIDTIANESGIYPPIKIIHSYYVEPSK